MYKAIFQRNGKGQEIIKNHVLEKYRMATQIRIFIALLNFRTVEDMIDWRDKFTHNQVKQKITFFGKNIS